jgi:hypothetical protein
MRWVVNSTLRPLYPLGKIRYPLYSTLGEAPRAGLDGCGKYRTPPGFDPRTVQIVSNRYTDWSIAVNIRAVGGYSNDEIKAKKRIESLQWTEAHRSLAVSYYLCTNWTPPTVLTNSRIFAINQTREGVKCFIWCPSLLGNLYKKWPSVVRVWQDQSVRFTKEHCTTSGIAFKIDKTLLKLSALN